MAGRKPIGDRAMTPAERQRRRRERLRDTKPVTKSNEKPDQAQAAADAARIRWLETELARLHARIVELEAERPTDIETGRERSQRAKAAAAKRKTKVDPTRGIAEPATPPVNWTIIGKGRDGRESFAAKIGRGRYDVSAMISPGAHHPNYYSVTHYVGAKERRLTDAFGVATADEGKALALADYTEGKAEERTKQAKQPVRFRI